MQFSFSTEQTEFAAGLGEMLQREFNASRLRQVWDDESGIDAELWSKLADMDVLSMLVPSGDGGMGGDLIDAVLLVEELGRAAVPGPVVETMVIGALALGGTEFAPGIADGTVKVAAALDDEPYVAHAESADVVVVFGDGKQGKRPVAHRNCAYEPVQGIDGGRRLAHMLGQRSEHDDSTALNSPAGETFELDVDAASLFDAAALASAAYLLGLSSRMLVIAGDYARDRRQFGQPIGSFQAVKHLMADALLKVEFARPAVYRAAWSHAVGADTRARDVSMAKALASEAAQKAARSALQVHGAIGYTWECDLQLYMKKAWALVPAWGSARFHRRRVADAVLGGR